MKITNTKIAVSVLSVLFAATAMNAQNTPASIDKSKMESMWINNSNNAAGGMIDAPEKSAQAYFGYDKTDGDFKKAQLGDDNSTVKFHTDGGGIYKQINNMYIWGEFNYTRDDIAGARWNSTLVDPTRTMPFFLADSTASKWKNQIYEMKFKAGFPKLFDRLYVGIGGTYQVAQAAKQIDPRPLTKMSKVQIQPSVIFEINENNHFGANFDYISYREDGSAENSNTRVDPQGWEMVAPGFFTQGVVSYFSSVRTLRNYNANTLGGGVQYGVNYDNFKALVAGEYSYKVEDVTMSYTTPRMAGTVKEDTWKATLAAQYNFDDGNILFFNYKYQSQNTDGIEYFQTYDNTYEVQSYITDAKFIRSNFNVETHTVAADYMITDSELAYKWKFGAEASVIKDDYIYYVPETTRNVNTFNLSAYATGNFKMNDSFTAMLTVKGGHSFNNKGEFDYNGTRSGNAAYTDFALKDFNYMCTEYTHMGAELTVVCNKIFKSSTPVFASCGYTYYKPSGDLFDSRSIITCKLGMTF